jgi:hypothetical protein
MALAYFGDADSCCSPPINPPTYFLVHWASLTSATYLLVHRASFSGVQAKFSQQSPDATNAEMAPVPGAQTPYYLLPGPLRVLLPYGLYAVPCLIDSHGGRWMIYPKTTCHKLQLNPAPTPTHH